MIDRHPLDFNTAQESLFFKDWEISPPPETLARDAVFLKTELILPLNKFTPEHHLHQTGQSLIYAGIEQETGERFVLKVNYREIQTTFALMGSMYISLEEPESQNPHINW